MVYSCFVVIVGGVELLRYFFGILILLSIISHHLIFSCIIHIIFFFACIIASIFGNLCLDTGFRIIVFQMIYLMVLSFIDIFLVRFFSCRVGLVGGLIFILLVCFNLLYQLYLSLHLNYTKHCASLLFSSPAALNLLSSYPI